MAQACTIGPDTAVNGRITGEEDVHVLGTVEGTIALSSMLLIESSGTVTADVEAQSIAVRGALHGDVVARDVVTLHSGCQVTGNLRAPRVVIEEGARFKGNIDMDVSL